MNGEALVKKAVSWDLPAWLGSIVSNIRVPAENKTPAPVVTSTPPETAVNTPASTNNSGDKTPVVAADNSTASNTGGSTVQSPPVSTDTQAPRITDIAYVSSDYSVTISWKTSENASSFIKYGTDLSLPFPSTEIPQLSTDHSIFINGLTPNTRYHYQIISKDTASNTGTSGGTTEDDRTFSTQPITNSAPYSGSVAPDFTLKKLGVNGLQKEEISLSQYRGKKVILNFWASWCTPCKMELPHLQTVWNKYRNSSDVMVLTVAGSQSDVEAIQDFMAQNNFDFTVCLDEYEGVFNNYGITSIPRTYFLDKNGVIHKIQQGMFTSPGEVEFMLDSY
jgi:peroxiredoxin